MDEMTLLQDLGRDLESLPPATLARQRTRLVEATRPSARTPRRPRRLVVATGALSAAASITVAIGTAAVTHPAWLSGHDTRPTPTPTMINAAYVLTHAADTVETRPAVHPRPNQWAYTKEIQTPHIMNLDIPPGQSQGKPEIIERWIRFDGVLEGSLLNGSKPLRIGKAENNDADDGTFPLRDYTRMAALPTDPDALVKQMCPYAPKAWIRNSCVFDMAAKYLPNVAVPPRLQAAFYRALSRLPNITVKRDVVDMAGRHDLAIVEAIDSPHIPGSQAEFRSEILLDPTTYEYRGKQEISTQRWPLISPDGTLAPHYTQENARLVSGVVDKPGARR